MLGHFRAKTAPAQGSLWRGKRAAAGSGVARSRRLAFEPVEPRLVLDGGPLISEFMAVNSTGLQDFEGERPDWLEIHNPGIQAVDLTDWKLRDSNNEWIFPSMSLGPGEFRVIFASGKDLRDPAGELHTNFGLKGDGEYLGLLDDTGAVVHEYDEYPPQTADISYGIAQDIDRTDFVASGDVATYLVPGGDPGAWTLLTFDDGGWATGETALGFADTVPGFAVWNYKANVTVGHLDTAVQVIENPGMQSYVNSENIGVINYWNNEGGHGHYLNEVDMPGFTSAMDDFVVEATGYVTIPSAGQWSFGVNSDDGFSLELDNGTQNFYMDYPTPRGATDTINTFDFPEAGIYSLRLVYYERGGGASVEVFAAQGAYGAFDAGAFDLVGDTANGGLEIFSEPVGGGSTGSTFAGMIETDVEDVMKDVNASLLVRLPFSVEDPTLVESLTLKMKYDDGYVAYLNGQEIARQNAPASPTWNSHATAERTDAQATAWENVDVSAYVGRLNSDDGTPRPDNVLAVHAMNYAADDGDFLVLPELAQILFLGLGEHFFATATPGDVNSEEYWQHVEDTEFSHDRGFYDEPFDLRIATDSVGAEIYYTTDGSEPSPTNGELYHAPIRITKTTVVRAAAFKTYYAPSTAATQTYIFLEDVIGQPANPADFPGTWRTEPADYEMDPRITGDPLYSDQLEDALRSIPTMSIVMDMEDLFGYDTGIYSNPNGQGLAWERPASLEFFDPDGSDEFQINAGLRMYGGVGRNPGYKKHSFRFLFKGDYGPTKLRYPLFGQRATDEFDTIILRSNFNDAWVWAGANVQFIRDEFAGRTQLDMGYASRLGNFVHLYLNGVYWGLYNPCERPDQSFSASYFGGDKEDWDGVNSGQPTGESSAAPYNTFVGFDDTYDLTTMADYQEFMGNNPDGTNNPAYETYLDAQNYINYLLLNFYIGNRDWPSHNWYAGRLRGPESTGFKWYSWDAEWIVGLNSGVNDNMVGTTSYLCEPYGELRYNPEFQMLFADAVHKHMFNGGALTPEASIARYGEMADEIELSVITESARWGDVASGTPYDLDDWSNQRDWVLNTYLTQRTNIVLGQLRSAGLYPSVEAPSYRVNGVYQHGGTISVGDSLTMVAPAGTIYYTLDGSDPRPVGGGGPDPADRYTGAVTLGEATHVKSRVYNNGQWSALNEATFYVDLAPSIRITEIMYNPADPTPDEVAQGHANNDDFEFLEIQNISATQTLPLGGLRFNDGIDFTFPNVSIAPGEYLLIVKDQDAFNYRYDAFAGTIAGEYGGSLSNGGEQLELDAPNGGIIHWFEFKDGWYNHTDGEGFSLTIRDPQGAAGLWDLKEGWRASAAPGGTPGYGDTLVTPGSIVITEVLAHSDAPFVDTIELHNVSDSPVDVSGWFLSDQKTDDLGNGMLTKYQIPVLPAVQAGAYLVLYEDHHFGAAFSLSELGDDLYLSSNFGGMAGGYREHVDFGASPRNVAFGLHTKSTGGTDFTLLSAHSFGSDNAYPYLEDLVINEVMYHPADPTPEEAAAGFVNDDDFEFVEIHNASTTTTYTLSDFYVGTGIGFTFGWYDADNFGREAWTLESGATATWNGDLPAGRDTYEVFARWDLLDAEGNQRELDGRARYLITHADGATAVIRDQEPELDDEGPDYMDPEGWVSLGTYDFDGSGQVVLTRGTDNPGNWTIADQVKFVSVAHEEIVDDPTLDSWYTGHGPATIGPGEYVVIVSNYDAFDERYDVAANGIPVAGQYTANLANGGEKVKLFRVGDPEPGGYIPYYRIDYVNYGDASPWPLEPDGHGSALNRVDPTKYGNDPIHWEASSRDGTPGSANIPLDRTPPSVPANLSAHVTVAPETIWLTWDAAHDDETYVDYYLVYRDEELLGTSATTSFDDSDVSPAVFYSYQVSAVNRDGYESEPSPATVVAVPGIVSYAIPDEFHIEIIFTEPLDPTTAEVLGNYAFTGGTLLDADLAPGGVKVTLTTLEEMVIGNSYSLTINNLATLSGNEVPDGLPLAFVYEPRGAGFILREYWTGIGGSAISDLTSNPNYPDNPTGENYPTSLEGPVNWAESYGTRIRGYVHPPTTGDYTFWVAGDDNCELHLSTDSNPAGMVLIASVPGWTSWRVWDTFAEQQSLPISLVAGQKYYIEALHKEGGGDDSISVRWQLPDGSWENAANPNEPIPGIRLSPYVDDPTPVAGDDSYEVTEGSTLSVGDDGVLANDYDPLPGPAPLRAELVDGPAHAESFDFHADGTFQYTPAPGYTGPDSFDYRVHDGGEYSQPATVHIAVVEMVRILSVEATDETHVEVLFSTVLDTTSAETIANYLVDGGLGVESASLGGDFRTVTLVLSPALSDNQDYRLSVSNVRDVSLAYVIAPNTQVVFRHVTWLGQDIGVVGAAGSHDEQGGVWTIEGSGDDIWLRADEFYYVYQPFKGDGMITARVVSVENTDGWAKAGVMFRESLDPGSAHAMSVVTPGSGVSFQRRRVTNGDSYHTTHGGLVAPYWVRVVREGSTFNSYRSPDGNDWTLIGTDTITMTQPTVYVGLAVTSHVAGVLCTAVIDNVSVVLPDTEPPTANIIDVTPDPRSLPVDQISIVFSEAVTGVDLSDLSLMRDGGDNLLTGAESLETFDNLTWTLSGLADLTVLEGTYTLTLIAEGSGIEDAAGNLLADDASDTWETIIAGPTADVVDVSPDPRNSAVSQIQIVFSEAVTGFDVGDLSLTRDGGGDLLSGTESLSSGDDVTWTLGDLAGLTGAAGSYTLTLSAAGSGIQNAAAEPLAFDASDTWAADTTAPTADVVNVDPDPRDSAVEEIDIVFSEPVTGLEVGDLSLTRDGSGNLLTGAEPLTTTDHVTWTLGGLGALTGTGAKASGFVAYNDHVAGAGTHANTTTYAANGTPSGLLKDIATGADTAVTLAATHSGARFADAQAVPAPGTDAFNLFDGFVYLGGGGGASIELEAVNNDYYTHTFSELDTGDAATYDFYGTAIRGNSDYANRWTLVTLEGADAFTPAHSTGIGVVTAGLGANEVALWTGHNSAADQGFVVGWTEIDPGEDGEFSIVSTQYTGSTPGVGTGTANGSKGYGLGGIRLEELAPTGFPGTYTLFLGAAGAGIEDAATNPLAANAFDTWIIGPGEPDSQPPTADVVDVAPDPRDSAVDAVDVVFDERVIGLDVDDLRLTRDGGDNLLTGGEPLTTPDNITWTLGGLSGLTAEPGTYTLALTAAGSGIADGADNPLAGDASDSWIVEPDGRVEGRFIFYNNSKFDGNSTAADAADDLAVAPDKAALLPGGTASFANYTSYSRGINGIMVDIAGMPDGAVPDIDDFRFRVGNNNSPGTWTAAPGTPSITVRPGAGTNDSDRITIIWPDNTLQKQWLQVTVLTTDTTRLAEEDVFYFGNAIGDSGNSTIDAKVNAFDMLGARDNQRTFLTPAAIDFPYDYNRDARVNTYDMLIARDNQTHFLNALRLITVPGSKGSGEDAVPVGKGTVHDAVFGQAVRRESGRGATSSAKLDWLYEFQETSVQKRPSEEDKLSEETWDTLLASALR